MTKKHMMRNAVVAGGLLAVLSIAFEYVRMDPDFRLIVEPWSKRGYEITQGTVVAVIGVGIAIVGFLAASDRGSNIFNAIVGFGVWLAAILIAGFADPRPIEAQVASFPALVITVIVAYMLIRVLYNLLRVDLPKKSRRYATLGGWAVLAIVGYFALVNPNIVAPNSTEMDLAVFLAIALGILIVSALTSEPRGLAVSRIAILSAFVGWIVTATIGSGTRAGLIASQLEETGVSATYRETQITSGIMLAFAGLLIALIASIAIWASKRDILQVKARARRQQDAAEQSAAELAGTAS